MIRIILLAIFLFLLAQILWQHNRCGFQWRDCDPFMMVPCDPVEVATKQEEEYKELARHHPYR